LQADGRDPGTCKDGSPDRLHARAGRSCGDAAQSGRSARRTLHPVLDRHQSAPRAPAL